MKEEAAVQTLHIKKCLMPEGVWAADDSLRKALRALLERPLDASPSLRFSVLSPGGVNRLQYYFP